MTNSILAVLLTLALQIALGALAGLRPVALNKAAPNPLSAAVNLLGPSPQVDEPSEAVTVAVGGDFGFCLGTDPRVLRQAAADALGLTLEALEEELRGANTLGAVAEAHGVSRADLVAALQAASQASLRDQLDPLVAAGELTEEQAGALLTLQATRDLSALLDLPFFFALPGVVEVGPGELSEFGLGAGELRFGEGFLRASPGGLAFSFEYQNNEGEPFVFELNAATPEVQAALAQALSLSEAELAERLAAGETLADLAAAQGVDPETLHAAWREAALAKARAELDAAVAAGRFTRATADGILAQLDQSLSTPRPFLHVRPFSSEGGPWPFFFDHEQTGPNS